jgi:hypothetical protein
MGHSITESYKDSKESWPALKSWLGQSFTYKNKEHSALKKELVVYKTMIEGIM